MRRHIILAVCTGLLLLLGCSASSTRSTGSTESKDVPPTAGDDVPTAGPDTEVAPDASGDTTPTPRVNTCTAPENAAVADAAVPDGFCASVWATGLAGPRGMRVLDNGDVLVIERSLGQVTVLWDEDQDGVSGDGERAVLAQAPNLNHGILFHDGFLYASSPTQVFRWAFSPGTRAALGEADVVIHGIPAGGHSTRSLLVRDGSLYVQVGSAGNVDQTSVRSRILRFPLTSLGFGAVAFDAGEVFADGLRNEVGLALDAQNRIWGVENGVDNLNRADLGGDIHADNPAEELNRFDEAGAFYGYPYCWSEFLLPEGVGRGPNAQWAHPSFMNDGTHDDAWCSNPEQVVPPAFSLQAHSAPLDLHFYRGGSFPNSMVGDLFVTMHGSWNRPVPTGYKVVRVRFEAGEPTEVIPFFEYAGDGDISSDWPHRPVAVDAGPDGALFVTSDKSNTLFRIGYTP